MLWLGDNIYLRETEGVMVMQYQLQVKTIDIIQYILMELSIMIFLALQVQGLMEVKQVLTLFR